MVERESQTTPTVDLAYLNKTYIIALLKQKA